MVGSLFLSTTVSGLIRDFAGRAGSISSRILFIVEEKHSKSCVIDKASRSKEEENSGEARMAAPKALRSRDFHPRRNRTAWMAVSEDEELRTQSASGQRL